MTQQVSTNKFATAKWIVDGAGLAEGATHTTIAAAITSASSGETIVIRPATYTENITLKAGVTLTSFDSINDADSTPKIIGQVTVDSAGDFVLSNLNLQTNSAFALVVEGTVAVSMRINNCFLGADDNTHSSFTNTNTATIIRFNYCVGDLATTGIAYWASGLTANAFAEYYYCNLNNSGNSSTANTITSSHVRIRHCYIQNPITTSSTGGLRMYYSHINPQSTSTCLTHGGTAAAGFRIASFCRFGASTVTASAISIGSGATLELAHVQVDSSNTNAVTGAGTLQYASLSFENESNMDVTTQTLLEENHGSISFDGGQAVGSFLDFYERGSWTPISLGVSTAGAGTYSVQVGRYQRIGNRVFYQAYLIWSAHTGTGDLRLGGLPFTSTSTTNSFSAATLRTSNLVMTNEYLQGFVRVNDTTITLETAASGTQANVAMDTATQFMVQGHYQV